MQADTAMLSDEALEAALKRSLSCPPRLAGGDDAARFGIAHGYNAKFCADLQRYAVTLADLAALERRESEEGATDEDEEYGLACYELVCFLHGCAADLLESDIGDILVVLFTCFMNVLVLFAVAVVPGLLFRMLAACTWTVITCKILQIMFRASALQFRIKHFVQQQVRCMRMRIWFSYCVAWQRDLQGTCAGGRSRRGESNARPEQCTAACTAGA
jgi:hypothetical protein